MYLSRTSFAFLLTLCFLFSGTNLLNAQNEKNKKDFTKLRVMAWNIWHGGREDGKEVGPKRVVEVIQKSKADIVAMQETYGSGERISKRLGFHYQPRGTNLSIHSRYPIVEDISVFQEFKCVGSLIELPNCQKIAFYCIWLPYGKDIWLEGRRKNLKIAELQKACQPSASDLQKIYDAIKKRLADKKYKDVSIMVAGDFNSMSHLDYCPTTEKQFGQTIDWKTSRILIDAGFRDSYRETNPVIDRKIDSTWTPRFPKQEQDRIDFVYYKSDFWRATSSRVIRDHAVKFPSDHAAILSIFEPRKSSRETAGLIKAVTYNIKRGLGNDNKTDLSRAAKTLQKLNPDIIALQEVDWIVNRSGKVNQPMELGKQLKMHAAFGSFMEYQGGKYGMAVLSRYPIQSVERVKLPRGNEPRIALAVKVLLPDNRSLLLVNVHFDWVRDDKFRFAQAKTLKEYLDKQSIPYVLLGDFNDSPDSRTVKLLSKGTIEANKPAEDRFTFSATNPKREIDFIFAHPANQWKVKKTKVIDESMASDHRPVFAELKLQKK